MGLFHTKVGLLPEASVSTHNDKTTVLFVRKVMFETRRLGVSVCPTKAYKDESVNVSKIPRIYRLFCRHLRSLYL